MYTFTGLTPGTFYTIKITACSAGGESEPVTTTDTTPTYPDPPANLQVTLLGQSGGNIWGTFSYTSPYAVSSAYQYSWGIDLASGGYVYSSTSNDKTVNWGPIPENTNYIFKVQTQELLSTGGWASSAFVYLPYP